MIHIAICDDNSCYHEILKYRITDYMIKNSIYNYEIIDFTELKPFYDYYRKNKVDILFLDIMINGINSMNWSIENLKMQKSQIIFITSYPESAYNISESECCYFLLKSKVDENSLAKAMDRALNKVLDNEDSTLIIKSISGTSIVNCHDILYVESFKNNIIFHLANGKKIVAYSSLKIYENKLPNNFLRCHKSYLINTIHVTGYQPYKFILDSLIEIPIPQKKYTHVINQYINSFKEV